MSDALEPDDRYRLHSAARPVKVAASLYTAYRNNTGEDPHRPRAAAAYAWCCRISCM